MVETQLRNSGKKIQIKNLKCDFTPSDLISFIITDTKIFKPAAISDELIKLYNY